MTHSLWPRRMFYLLGCWLITWASIWSFYLVMLRRTTGFPSIISSSIEDGLSLWLGCHSPLRVCSLMIFLAHLTSSTWSIWLGCCLTHQIYSSMNLVGVSDLGVGLHAKSTLNTIVVHCYPTGLSLDLSSERPSSGGFINVEVGRINLGTPELRILLRLGRLSL